MYLQNTKLSISASMEIQYMFDSNPCHNILAIYCLSVQVWFATTKTLITSIIDSVKELPQGFSSDSRLNILGN